MLQQAVWQAGTALIVVNDRDKWVQTGPRAYPVTYTMGTGHIPGIKAAGAWH